MRTLLRCLAKWGGVDGHHDATSVVNKLCRSQKTETVSTWSVGCVAPLCVLGDGLMEEKEDCNEVATRALNFIHTKEFNSATWAQRASE